MEFVLGAFTVDSDEVASATQDVVDFTTDRVVNITFSNCKSLGATDCRVLAWLPQAQPRNRFTESEPFTVTGERPGGLSVSEASSSTNPVSISSGLRTFSFTTSIPNTSSTTTSSPTTSIPTESILNTSSPTASIPNTSSPVSSPTASDSTSSVPGTVSDVPPKPASHTGVIVGGVLGFLALGCLASASIYVLLRRRRPKASSMLSLRSQDRTAPLPAPFILKYSSQRGAGAQLEERVPAVSRYHLDAEFARVREEIRSLQLDNQIRRMEAGYDNPPPPSYESASSSPRSISFDT